MRRPFILFTLLTLMTVTSCDSRKSTQENPFFRQWETPFGMPPFDQIRAEHYKPAYVEAMQQHYNEIDSIIASGETPGFDNVIAAFDRSGSMLRLVEATFRTVNSADSNEKLREVEREMSPILSAHYDNINMNERLFAKVKAVYDNRNSLGLDALQMRTLEKIYQEFVRSGALLSAEDKSRLKEINSELALARITFGNNVREANNSFMMVVDTADVASLPNALKDAAFERAEKAGQKGYYAFDLSRPSLFPFLSYSDRSDLRERMYHGYIDRCNYNDSLDNRPVINRIIELRTQQAQLLGFDNFADYVLEDRMADSPAAVYSLLNDLWTPAIEAARREASELSALKKQEQGTERLDNWDWWYYTEKLRKRNYDLDDEMTRPYFSLAGVQAGIFELSNRLYGVTFRPVNIPVYNKDCVTFEVLDIDNTHLGILLMDFHPRPGKNPGAWCSGIRGRDYVDGEKISDPIVTIVCNFTPKTARRPSLLTLEETETFFHEFGHALHSLFTDVPYRRLQRTERDFVELPSQIMENWAFEPAMLRKYANHYNTGAVIPETLIKKINDAATFNQGFMMTEHLASALTDMDIYTYTGGLPFEINDFEAENLYVRRNMPSEIAPRYRFPYFNHIFSGGYSAGYYSYKWAEVLDKDAYEAFAETGDVFNKRVAARFRTEILEKGGSQDGMTLFRNFRGREPERDYLLYSSGLKERPARVIIDYPDGMQLYDETQSDSGFGNDSLPEISAQTAQNADLNVREIRELRIEPQE